MPRDGDPIAPWPESIRCDEAGVDIAIRPDRNAAVREALLMAGVQDEGARRAQWILCSRSISFFAAYFAWTYKLRAVTPDGREIPEPRPHRPFIPWPVQIDALKHVVKAIREGDDVLADKSRDMGASWIYGAILPTWAFLFWPDSHSLMASRVEELVDRTDDPDSIFWKIDYIIRQLPWWLLPCERAELARGGSRRAHMLLANPANGATITGRATTEHLGRGGRRAFVLLDEFGSMANQEDIWRVTKDVTATRIANSTPVGGGHTFTRLRDQGLEIGTPRVVRLLYDGHPEKSRGGVWRVDTKGAIIGKPGLLYLDSPWFRQQATKRDRLDLAKNVLAVHEQSGDMVFDAASLHQQRATNVRPARRCDLAEVGGGTTFVPSPIGNWYVFVMPNPNGRYVIFADPSSGVGAANAVLQVLDADSGEQMAEFVSPGVGPWPLAQETALAARTVFRGCWTSGAFVGWETNGPGASWASDLKRAGHRHLFRERPMEQSSSSPTHRYGWLSDRRKKRAMIGAMSTEVQRGTTTIHSDALISEAFAYVVLDDGAIDTPLRADMETGARESHGDRVVAYAGALMLRSAVGTDSQDQGVTQAPGTLGAILKHGPDGRPGK